jgi:PAS domain S-box-containing protein
MKPGKPVRSPKRRGTAASAAPSFEDNVLRLRRGAPEARAIRAGEVDAILDPASGRAILMPEAQAVIIERKIGFRSLVDLASDGYWEQDEDYRFVLHTGATIGNERTGGAGIIGKTLWELSFDNGSEIDWQTHRTQLEWRAIFRDLELSCVDSAGRLRRITLSGEPMLDADARFKGYHGITRDITEQESATTAAPGSDGFAHAMLDALTTQICALDEAGTIIAANRAWRAFAATDGNGSGLAENDNYLAACAGTVGNERVDAVAMAAGVRQVIAGEREAFRYELLCGVPPAARWFMVTVTRLRGAATARAAVSYEDITEIKHAERLQKLECTVARCLAVDDDTSASVQAVIRAVCAAQGWDCGRHFRLDSAAGVLAMSESWAAPEAAVEKFVEESRGAVFRADAGLAGRVCDAGQPLWILSASPNAPASPTALAHETGLAGAFFFPVMAAGKSIGVLAFNGRNIRDPDERLLQAARSIGEQLGQFLQQRQTRDDLRASEERFRRLTELSVDWHWEQDAQFRFTNVAGAGMDGAGDMLGKTLWELPGIVPSDDLRGWVALKTEVAAYWSFCDFECAVALPNGQLKHYSLSGEPLYDGAGVFEGFHGTALDITERKRAEIALRQRGVAPAALSPLLP